MGKGKLKIGIISAGQISKNHIEGYIKAGAEVVAICDPNRDAVEKRLKEFSIPNGFESIDEVLKIKGLDAVSVCSPNVYHCEYVVKALQKGLHVLTEKPMAMNVAQAQKMVDAAKKAKKLLMCGHNQRFLPECQKIDELRRDGSMGDVYHAKCAWIRRRGIPGLGGWFTTKSLSGGGPLIDIGIHLIDRTWFMMGRPKPVSVSGVTYSKFGNPINDYVCTGMWAGPRNPKGKMDVEDFASAFIRFENGATMTAEVSWAVNRPDEMWSLVLGDKTGARVDDAGITLYGERGQAISTESIAFDKSVYADRFQHFCACLRGEVKKCMCPGDDGLVIQKILNGIYKSSETKREVAID